MMDVKRNSVESVARNELRKAQSRYFFELALAAGTGEDVEEKAAELNSARAVALPVPTELEHKRRTRKVPAFKAAEPAAPYGK